MFARRYSVHKGALRVSRCALEDLKKAFRIFSSLNLFLFLMMAPGLSHFLLLLVAGLAYFGKESTVWALRYQAAGDWNPLTGNAPELASDPVENADEPSSRIQSFVEASKDNSSSGGDRDKGEGDKSHKKGIGERLRHLFFVRKSGSGTSKGNRGISESHLGTPGKYTQKWGSSSTTSLRGAEGGKKETPTDKKET
ncbi:putative transmembrane protein, partial [Toxoplasma gondii TgCatPRC2]